MFRSLRNKLVLLYSVSTGLILILVLIVLFMLTQRSLEAKRLEVFQDHGDTIINRLQFGNIVNDSWLSQLEMKNHLIIHIEDNGNSLAFPGVLRAPTKRETLLKQLTALALEEGIDLGKNPIFFNAVKSSVFKITGTMGERYYGLAVIIPTNSGWRSLSLLQYLPNYYSSILNQRILFSLLGLAGIAALILVSLCFVSRMLKPLEENSQRQTGFIAAASHELRSPLSVITANTAAISDVSAESQKFIDGINRECRRMARLIDDMLFLASADAKRWTIKKEPVEADTLLVETYEAFLPLFRSNERSLLLDLPEEELPPINTDKDRLKQVFAILLDNALSYVPAGKTVKLRGYVCDSHLNLEVEDQGIGIKDKEKRLIFDRFYRIDKSRNDKKHFGLGLSIAKELIQLQGGKIMVRDTEGGGATFVVRFHL